MTSVGKINCCGSYIQPNKLDYEYRRIIQKLKEYGMFATGDKQTDKMRLRAKELEELQQVGCINPQMLTVPIEEQTKVLTEKKEKEVEKDSNYQELDYKGQEALGEQIYLAIMMKDKDDSRIKKFLEEKKKAQEL